jgi:hypothetical protein
VLVTKTFAFSKEAEALLLEPEERESDSRPDRLLRQGSVKKRLER